MLRLIATLTVLLGFAGSAMAYPITSSGTFGLLDQTEPAPDVDTATIKLELGGTLTPLFATWSSPNRGAALIGGDLAIMDGLAAPQGEFTPSAAFAAVTLEPGVEYTLAIFGDGVTTLTFDVTEVPLPGAAVLFGSAIVGLGLYRRRARVAA